MSHGEHDGQDPRTQTGLLGGLTSIKTYVVRRRPGSQPGLR